MPFPPLEIELTNGGIALVDCRDYLKVCGRSWRRCVVGKKKKKVYATAATHQIIDGARRHVMLYMHRVVMDAPPGIDVDHIRIDDTLDNRRENLRLATRGQNLSNSPRVRNKSPFRGVSQSSPNRWIAKCGRGGYIDCFSSPEDAARAYDVAAVKKYGEFAVLNFPHEHGRSAPSDRT